jgi:cytochrome P450
MKSLFSDGMRRNPYPIYEQMRKASSCTLRAAAFRCVDDFDYQGVKRALNDHDSFSSRVPAPRHWFVFLDPPSHTKLRALISQAFTPRVIGNLGPRIRELSRQLLNRIVERGEADLAAEYPVPLPIMVIAEMIGMPVADWPQFNRWSDVILKLSYTRSGGEEAVVALSEFRTVTAEMDPYLREMIEQRRAAPKDDLVDPARRR